MTDEVTEIDIVAAFGAKPIHGERFAIYVPNKDKEGKSFDQKPWIEQALELLSEVGGGASAMPPLTGAWLNSETGKLIFEEPVVVYSYIRPDDFVKKLKTLVGFVKRLGRETDQGEIAIEWDGEFFTVDDFTE